MGNSYESVGNLSMKGRATLSGLELVRQTIKARSWGFFIQVLVANRERPSAT